MDGGDCGVLSSGTTMLDGHSDDQCLLNLDTSSGVVPPPPNDTGHEFIGPSSGPPQVTITPSPVSHQPGERGVR